MAKDSAKALCLLILATPLVLVGCEKKCSCDDAAGAAGNIGQDGAAGAGGARLDGGAADAWLPAVDSAPAGNGPATPDAPTVGDGGPGLDANLLDASTLDLPALADVAAADSQAGDAAVAIDSAPAGVCTETVKFVGGDVTIDRTLSKACSPYTITKSINVNGNAILTIEPGVTLNFATDLALSIGYSSAGKLLAVGTATSPIVFTSSAVSPGAGDWAGIQLWTNALNGIKLSYVRLEYCGARSDACLVSSGVKANRVTVDHVTFAHVGSGSDAIWQKDKDSNFAISNCTFDDIPSTPTQQYAISVYAPSFAGIDSTNTFNGNAMVQMMGDTISVDTTWKNIHTDVAVTSELTIGGAATPTLTIAAGNTFKFATETGIRIGYSNPGKLLLAGTATDRITLTSLSGTPGAGDWNGILLWSSSSAKIQYATISYGGSPDASSTNGAVGVVSNNSSLDIQNSAISYSGEYGIGIPCNSTASVTNIGNTFTSNTKGDVGPGPTGPDCS